MKKIVWFIGLLFFISGCSITVEPSEGPYEPPYQVEPLPEVKPDTDYGVWSGVLYRNGFYQGEIFVDYNNNEWTYCPVNDYCDYGTTKNWYLYDNNFNIDFYGYPNTQTNTVKIVRRLNQSTEGILTPVKYINFNQ